MSTRHLTDSAHLDGPALDARHESARDHDFTLSERLGAEILEHTKGHAMSAREQLLTAMDDAAQAHLDYLQSRITYRAYAKAMDHVAVCRDAAGADFFRVVRLPERNASEVV